jgi:hypothetical protein
LKLRILEAIPVQTILLLNQYYIKENKTASLERKSQTQNGLKFFLYNFVFDLSFKKKIMTFFPNLLFYFLLCNIGSIIKLSEPELLLKFEVSKFY